MNRTTVIVGMALLSGCSKPVHTGPDMGPVGDGLEFLGMALVLGAIILVVGNLFRD